MCTNKSSWDPQQCLFGIVLFSSKFPFTSPLYLLCLCWGCVPVLQTCSRQPRGFVTAGVKPSPGNQHCLPQLAISCFSLFNISEGWDWAECLVSSFGLRPGHRGIIGDWGPCPPRGRRPPTDITQVGKQAPPLRCRLGWVQPLVGLADRGGDLQILGVVQQQLSEVCPAEPPSPLALSLWGFFLSACWCSRFQISQGCGSPSPFSLPSQAVLALKFPAEGIGNMCLLLLVQNHKSSIIFKLKMVLGPTSFENCCSKTGLCWPPRRNQFYKIQDLYPLTPENPLATARICIKWNSSRLHPLALV